ncbi:MAG: small subunit ribosomal protein [Thermoleophilaceae bacterium]|nr:small subunit ribosomal protein [Thermoleophilaceae bacterium]
MAQVGIKELLEAGVHFGHQTRRWNPKMRRFIFGERAGIHIIDLQQTDRLLKQAQEFTADIASRGGTVMFVGTKKQARDSIKEAAENAGMPYIDQRWLGGLLTNFQTISKRIKRLHDLNNWVEDGTLELLPTRERISAMSEREKLTANLGGVRNLQRPPDAIFFVDLKTEAIGVREAERLRIPIIALVDTNVDPDPVTFPIPGNDDAIRSCKVIIEAIADGVGERHAQFRAEEEAARKEAEEKARIEAEAKAKRDAEERERKEAEEKVKREAEQRAQAEAAARAAAAAQTAQPAAEAAPAAPEPPPAQAAPEPPAAPAAPEPPAAAAAPEPEAAPAAPEPEPDPPAPEPEAAAAEPAPAPPEAAPAGDQPAEPSPEKVEGT